MQYLNLRFEWLWLPLNLWWSIIVIQIERIVKAFLNAVNNVWAFFQDQLQQKIVCPGIVTCLCASPDGLYVLAGIAEAIYLWEVRTGGGRFWPTRNITLFSLLWHNSHLVYSLKTLKMHDLLWLIFFLKIHVLFWRHKGKVNLTVNDCDCVSKSFQILNDLDTLAQVVKWHMVQFL